MVVSLSMPHSFARLVLSSRIKRVYANITKCMRPCLALAAAQLTRSHAQLLLAVAVKILVPVQRSRYVLRMRFTSHRAPLVTSTFATCGSRRLRQIRTIRTGWLTWGRRTVVV